MSRRFIGIVYRKELRDLLRDRRTLVSMIVMPVVVSMAHEAMPHLPGAVLMLLAVLAAACGSAATGINSASPTGA